jgi:glycerol-3-phosphate cytidylyltransferase
MQRNKIGITCSTFDLFHAGHVKMLEEAKKECDYLIVALQTDPSIDRPDAKNPPIQSLVERYIQVKACKYVDEIVPYQTEKDLEDIFASFDLDCRILGIEYKDKDFTGKDTCLKRGIEIIYNKRDHNFSSTELRSRVWEVEHVKSLQQIEKKFNKS